MTMTKRSGLMLLTFFAGGTPSQNWTPLTWDPHGCYEIALDAKSLTLSPWTMITTRNA